MSIDTSYLDSDDDKVKPARTALLAAVQMLNNISLAGNAVGSYLVGFIASGSGKSSRTSQDKLRDVISLADSSGIDKTGISDSTAGWNNFKASSTGRKLISAGSYKVDGLTRVYVNDVIEDNIQLFPPGYVGTETRAIEYTFRQDRAALRIGGSDTVSSNDERNFWRGLPSGGTTNSWGTPAVIGLFSAAFNRNGASYASYSNTFGHDCVTYGVASLAGGAGSCTGDPDAPTSPAFQGYCSFAWGKNVLASGEKSAALGEECKSVTRASFTAGYAAETGSYSGSGTGAVALGRSVKAFGEGSVAIGKFLQSSNGSLTVGTGISTSTVLNNQRIGAVGFGANTAYPSFYINQGAGSGASNDVGYTEFFNHGSRYTSLFSSALFTCATITPAITNGGGSGYGGIKFAASINGTMTDVCWVDSDSNIPSFLPTNDNSRNLGSATLRWGVVYAGTGTINTSDERDKTPLRKLTDKERRVAVRIKSLIRAFKFNDAVSEKGEEARIHFGVGAQSVKAAFEAEGLIAEKYAVLCLDKWEERQEVKDDSGNVVVEYRQAGERYGIRYEELLAFIISAI